ncbi:MAG: helix-turn-helix domain-containing protein [Oscillibacter sp.]|jgi:transcriptional regulator with XRE-family HTH domain|nr:helix-turn-helix domain-containing protein [Oscillibacter sp.]
MSLQEALKLLRFETGMTQEDLAKKLNKAFVTVNRWENGKGFPNRGNAKKILEIAQEQGVSENCIAYLNEVLAPDAKRGLSAAIYGFPDIDREFLFQLADESTNALYIVEAETYRLLYTNRKAQQIANLYRTEVDSSDEEINFPPQEGNQCYHYFGHRNAPCNFCPLSKLNSQGHTDAMITIPENGRKILIHAKAANMKGRSVFIVCLTDITLEDAERSTLYELANDIPAGVGIYHVYQDDRIELAFMNNVLYGMIGEERSRMLLREGPSKICLIHPQDKPRLMPKIRNALAEKRNVSIEVRMKVNSGQYEKILIIARLMKRSSKRITLYCLFHQVESDGSSEKE